MIVNTGKSTQSPPKPKASQQDQSAGASAWHQRCGKKARVLQPSLLWYFVLVNVGKIFGRFRKYGFRPVVNSHKQEEQLQPYLGHVYAVLLITTHEPLNPLP